MTQCYSYINLFDTYLQRDYNMPSNYPKAEDVLFRSSQLWWRKISITQYHNYNRYLNRNYEVFLRDYLNPYKICPHLSPLQRAWYTWSGQMWGSYEKYIYRSFSLISSTQRVPEYFNYQYHFFGRGKFYNIPSTNNK